MRKLKPFVVLIFALLLGYSSAHAQKSISNLFVSNVNRGDEMFLDFYYEDAIKYYELALKKDIDNTGLKLKIANSYRLSRDYKSSLHWYSQALTDSTTTDNQVDYFHYAEVLMINKEYDEAAKWYTEFYKSAPTDSRSYTKLNSLDHLSILFRDSTAINIENLPFNTNFDELGAKYYKQGLLYLSSRKSNALVDQDFMREDDLLDMFIVQYDSLLGWQESENFGNSINTAYHEGPFAFYTGQDKLILTRSNINENVALQSKSGDTKLQLFEVSQTDDKWSNGKKLSINDTEFSYAHPSLSAGNDTLYFSSDMEGGYGGSDIYMSIANGDDWSDPINIGYLVNTEGDEMYPYYIDDRLFFTSNGHIGLGGLDIYKAYIYGSKIANVVNVGSPINSSYDDFAYFIDKKSSTGTITSNRLGGAGADDIYGFSYLANVLNGLVTQEQDGTPIDSAIVKLFQGDSLIAMMETDQSGLFNFQLPMEKEFRIEVMKDEHFGSLPLSLASHRGNIDLDTVQISLHKHDLFAGGRILNNESQQLMPDVQVILHNLTDNKLDTLITSESGLYRFVLEPNKQYSIYAAKQGYLVGGADINTLTFSKGEIINDIVLELEYTKKGVVHFDYNKYNLRPETKDVLDRAVKAMRSIQNKLIVSAFADARGTKEYNQKLSDRRANAVLDYLVSHGVSASRITANGFGETLILNHCVDGIHCEEIEHSKNRRA
jgi:outer membrane protein OmpA-like peptidoglycan-associated protein/tetratricopeptide (TPR) repeat protein